MSEAALQIVNLKEFETRLKEIGDAASEALFDAAYAGGFVIEAHAKINIEESGLVDTGNLMNSVQTRLDQISDKSATASVGPRGVVYAAIHEYGGVIKASRAPYLVFQTKDGAWHSTKSVTIPARPYLRPACDLNQAEIAEAVKVTLERKIQEAAK